MGGFFNSDSIFKPIYEENFYLFGNNVAPTALGGTDVF